MANLARQNHSQILRQIGCRGSGVTAGWRRWIACLAWLNRATYACPTTTMTPAQWGEQERRSLAHTQTHTTN